MPRANRTLHRQISDELHAFIDDQERGNLCVTSLIQWVESRCADLTFDDGCHGATRNKSTAPVAVRFSTLWIYSHHIYSRIKRKDILKFAEELGLSGFSMPGKPGMIVVEGVLENVEEFWGRLRRMQWKKLTIVEKTDLSTFDNAVDEMRRFEGFQEMVFDPRGGKGREYHMDLGLLFEFLEKKGFGHIFQLYFGIDGKSQTE